MTRFLREYACELVLSSVFIGDHSEGSSHEPIAKPTPSTQSTKETREHDDVLKFIKVPTSALPTRAVKHDPSALWTHLAIGPCILCILLGKMYLSPFQNERWEAVPDIRDYDAECKRYEYEHCEAC